MAGYSCEQRYGMSALARLAMIYRTQLSLLRRWRAGRIALLKRALIATAAAVIAFNLTAWIAPGLVRIEEIGAGLLAVVFIALINLVARPILIVLTGWSFALLVASMLVFQALVIWLLTPIVPGVTVEGGILGALVVSFILGFFTAGASLLFGLGEDESYYGTLVRTLATRRDDVTHTDEPGLVVIQIDGLSHDVLSHSLRAGRVPYMASLIRGGSHRLAHWTALLPSTTPASQAGILHGNNDGIPNFRWYEKETGQLLVANHPEDATEIETRISNGEGLLSPGGASISNIFTGDADRALLVMSTIKVKERGLGHSRAFALYFASPYNYITMMARFLAEVIKENIQSRRQVRAGIEPLMHRGFPYPWVRAATNVALRALGTSLIVEEMMRGTSVIYMDYTDYDEIAHHSGPERPESLDALDGVDRELRTLARAAEDAPRPYRFVMLADHGQSLGATFLQRYGVTLQEVVRSHMGGSESVAAATGEVEQWGQLNTLLTEVGETDSLAGTVARSASKGHIEDGQVDFGPEDLVVDDGRDEERPDLVVVAGGNLGLMYFNTSTERLTLEQVDELHPDLVASLVAHPGIGFLIARSAKHGLMCLGEAGINYLDEHRLDGVDPLAIYGEHAAAAVRRLDEIEHTGDLAAISLYDPETGEIAAFEELIGAHGGLGGAQTRPFLLHPAEWEADLAPLIGAPMVYRQLRRWMEDELGMRFGKKGTRSSDANEAGG